MADPVSGVQENGPDATALAIARFRKWGALIAGGAALGYVGYAFWRGVDETAGGLKAFHWPIYVLVIALTFLNYGIRYVKWWWLLDRLDVRVPGWANRWIFLSGLAMVVSPGKAGELIKPYLVREITGVPMERTIPALLAERGTDVMAIFALTAFGISAYAPERVWILVVAVIAVAAGLGVVASETLSLGLVGLVRGPLPKIADRLETAWRSMRTCTTPPVLVALFAMSLVAWFAECLGYALVFRGLGVHAGIAECTFLYSFGTAFGGASSPIGGGVGTADAFLAEGALQLVPGLTGGQAVVAALLVRVGTLWLGVVLGAVALLRIESVIQGAKAELATPGTRTP